MDRWPKVDRALRARLLAELRTRQRREAAARLPAERIACLIEMVAFARRLRGTRTARPTDESHQTWRETRARLRALDGQG
jgi:hypothetical protein